MNRTKSYDAVNFLEFKPSFVERKGIQIIVSITIAIVITTFFIEYPDKVTQSGHLSTENAPKIIKSNVDGVLAKLLYKNDAKIDKGDIIGWISSDVNFNDIITLANELDTLEDDYINGRKLSNSAFFLKSIYKYNIADIQQSYGNLISSLVNYKVLKDNPLVAKMKNAIIDEKELLAKKSRLLDRTLRLTNKDIQIGVDLVRINQLLMKDSLILIDELKNSESQLIGKNKGEVSILLEQINNKHAFLKVESELIDILRDEEQKHIELGISIQELKSAIFSWINKYAIKARATGVVEFASFFQEGDYIKSSEVLGHVIPFDTEYYIKTYLGQSVLSKINEGTPVEIRVQAYSYKDYGQLHGQVSRLGNIVTDSGFVSKIDLKENLITDLNIKIPYKENLLVDVIFITKNKTLFEHLTQDVMPENAVNVIK